MNWAGFWMLRARLNQSLSPEWFSIAGFDKDSAGTGLGPAQEESDAPTARAARERLIFINVY